jgi:hypothetical protein
MRPRSCPPRLTRLGLPLLALALAAGCEEPRHARTKPKAPADAEQQPAPVAAQPAPEVVQPREVLGKRTMVVLDAEAELKKGAAEGTTKITAKDPITMVGNAYVTQTGRLGVLQIEQTVNLFKAAEDRYPKDHEEFMARIIKENNLALPMLPYYQEYGYHAGEHKLVILEYADRKAQLKKQQDAQYGR